MRRLVTSGVVLRRTNYGEADRILTVLTREYGKLSLMAKGVRRSKSKLAGSVELFCVSQVTFIEGRGEVGTLISARLEKHYPNIVKDLSRIQLGSEVLRLIDKNTEKNVDAGYYEQLVSTLDALNADDLPLALARIYSEANLLKLSGHMPNLTYSASGAKLAAGRKYSFDSSSASFSESSNGQYTVDMIKFLRLAFNGNSAMVLSRINNVEELAEACQPLVLSMIRTYLRE